MRAVEGHALTFALRSTRSHMRTDLRVGEISGNPPVGVWYWAQSCSPQRLVGCRVAGGHIRLAVFLSGQVKQALMVAGFWYRSGTVTVVCTRR